MAPGALLSARSSLRTRDPRPAPARLITTIRNCLFNRSSKNPPLHVVAGIGNNYQLSDGSLVYDASGGAGVANIGRYDKRVEAAIIKTLRSGLSYVPSLGFDTSVTVQLAEFLVNSTDSALSKAVFYTGGTDFPFL